MTPNQPRDPWWARAFLWCWFHTVGRFGMWIDRVFFNRKGP